MLDKLNLDKVKLKLTGKIGMMMLSAWMLLNGFFTVIGAGPSANYFLGSLAVVTGIFIALDQ
jgi:hypothetical protein